MLFYLIIDIVVASLFILLAALALFGKNGKDRQNRIFALFVGCLLVWLVTNQLSNDTTVPVGIVLWADYLLFASSFAATALLFDLVVSVSQDKVMQRLLRVLQPWLALLTILFATPLVGAGVHPQGAVYAVEFGSLGNVYGVALIAMMILSLVVVIRNWNHNVPQVKKQMRIVGMGMIITLPLVALLGYIIPYVTDSFAITQIAVAPCIILALTFYHAAIRHGLFDLRLVVMRTVVYILSLGTLAFVYFVLAYTVSWAMFQNATAPEGASVSSLNIILALILAFLFQPVKRFFDKLTDTLFYRHEYNRDDFFSELGHILAFSSNIQLLLERVAKYLAKTMKAQHVFFAVHYGKQRRVYGTSGHVVIPVTDMDLLRDFIEEAGLYNQLIRIDTIEDTNVQRIFTARHIALVLPLSLRDEHIGCLFLGEHQGRGYTARDMKTIGSIGGELVIALRNAMAVEEIRELNNSLKQRVDDATKELRTTNRQLQRLDEAKNEFISMASHQLRTPLTSIKGYLDMVLEGDLGKVTPTQKAVLQEAFSSSERMVQLINDFLNVSRLQTGKFIIDRHPSDLAELVREEIAMLEVVAKQRQLTIKAIIGQHLPEINIDAEKFRQVILNMIDNAIYYSQPSSVVIVKLVKRDEQLVFTVKDTGIGVPADEQAGLFGKFFRASNARKRRPDGTGVGLFLAKKVVLEHQGAIIFESAEGKGSTFGFSVPLKQPRQ